MKKKIILAIALLAIGGTLLTGFKPFVPKHAHAAGEPAMYDGFLRGTWIVRCPNGHDDQVEDITRNHDCEHCHSKSVDGGRANVVCPNGHSTHVEGITESHLCSAQLPDGGTCGLQCRR